MPTALLGLPTELLNNILCLVDLEDVPRLFLVSRGLNAFVKDNQTLFRMIYTRLFGEPSLDNAIDFKQEVFDVIRLRRLIQDSQPKPNKAKKTRDRQPQNGLQNSTLEVQLQFISRVVTRLLNNAAPASRSIRKTRSDTCSGFKMRRFLWSLFSSPHVRAKFMARSMLYRHAADMDMFVVPRGVDLNDDDPVAQARVRRRREIWDPDEPRDPRELDANGIYAEEFLDACGTLFQPPPHLRETCRLSAKLHCLYGVPLGFEEDHPAVVDAKRAINLDGDELEFLATTTWRLAAKKVYDLREYGTDTGFWNPGPNTCRGPFFDNDGLVRVDWQKVEAILCVLSFELRNEVLDYTGLPLIVKLFRLPFGGCWPDSYIPWTLEKDQIDNDKKSETKQGGAAQETVSELDKLDPYGVAGTWLRIVSFTDRHIFSFINSPLGLEESDPRNPDEFSQRTRVAALRLRITKVEPPSPDGEAAAAQDVLDRDPKYPVTHFAGLAHIIYAGLGGHLDNGENGDLGPGDGSVEIGDPAECPPPQVRGFVYMTSEGEVRWSMSTWYGAKERWRSDGVQVGGIRSARGVVGTWFDPDDNAERPQVGPTAYFKISDRVHGPDQNKLFWKDLLPLSHTGPDDVFTEIMESVDPEDEVPFNGLSDVMADDPYRDIPYGAENDAWDEMMEDEDEWVAEVEDESELDDDEHSDE